MQDAFLTPCSHHPQVRHGALQPRAGRRTFGHRSYRHRYHGQLSFFKAYLCAFEEPVTPFFDLKNQQGRSSHQVHLSFLLLGTALFVVVRVGPEYSFLQSLKSQLPHLSSHRNHCKSAISFQETYQDTSP